MKPPLLVILACVGCRTTAGLVPGHCDVSRQPSVPGTARGCGRRLCTNKPPNIIVVGLCSLVATVAVSAAAGFYAYAVPGTVRGNHASRGRRVFGNPSGAKSVIKSAQCTTVTETVFQEASRLCGPDCGSVVDTRFHVADEDQGIPGEGRLIQPRMALTRFGRGVRRVAAATLMWSCAVAVHAGGPRAFIPPPPSAMPGGQYGALVRDGYRIFEQTPRYAGEYTGNMLSCENCHLDGGRRSNAIPLWAAFGMYPRYQAKAGQVISYQQRLQQCFQFSENGYPPPLDSQVMRALSAYSHWLASGAPIGVQMPGRGLERVPATGHDPDPVAGKGVYAERCAVCHGSDGQGIRKDGQYRYPPLWGRNSFNRGAGMAKLPIAAAFIKATMPYGNADLTDQQADDVAAWMELQDRPADPRKGILTWLLER